MATVARPHVYPEGTVARPEHANANEIVLYNLVNGNIDWQNLKVALANVANGLVKLDADGKVPLAQMPSIVPSGVIVMWSGTLGTIPDGWSLCDGEGETPDLRDKFIYGCSDGVDPGDTGGAATHTHTYSQVPAHTHRIRCVAGILSLVGAGAEVWSDHGYKTGCIESTGVATGTTNAGSTLPPYYKLAFIQKD